MEQARQNAVKKEQLKSNPHYAFQQFPAFHLD